MNDRKHTPGPVERLLRAADDAADKIQAEFCNLVTDKWEDEDAMQVYENLFCATEDVREAYPFLLAALKGFLHADPDVFHAELEAARAAIAKAEGN